MKKIDGKKIITIIFFLFLEVSNSLQINIPYKHFVKQEKFPFYRKLFFYVETKGLVQINY